MTTGFLLFEKYDFHAIVLLDGFKTNDNSVFIICP